MLLPKRCKKCGLGGSFPREVKDCPQCQEKNSLERVFQNSVAVNTIVKDDHFMQIDRMMLDSKTPQGKTKTYI